MSLLNIVSGTPWWVWVVFIYLVVIGIQATKSITVSLFRMAIIPVILTLWSWYSLIHHPVIRIITWLIAFAVGILIGLRFFSTKVTVDKKNKRVHLAGSYLPLIFYLLFFLLKYVLGFTYAIHPEYKNFAFLWAIDAVSSGLISGIFSGRLLYIIIRYIK